MSAISFRSLLLAGLLCAGSPLRAFANVPLGSPLEDVVLATPAGGQEHLLGNATANVFIFLKPGQPHSQTFSQQLADLQKEMAGKSVRWVAVVSDRVPAGELQQAGLAMPVLIDAGDELYGKFGVVLEPALGIADQEHRLAVYQPYTKINFVAVIRARILHLLKEINDEALDHVLHPPAADNGGLNAAAHRRYRLAQKLFESKLYPKALENITISLEKDRTAAAAHVLQGQILAAMGKLEEAGAAYDRALALEPANEAAIAARHALALPPATKP